MRTYKIGFAAKAASVGVDTIRYYEREGLLSRVPRTESGYRTYSDDDIERLRFIRKAKALGFSLEDIAELLHLQEGSGTRREVRQRAHNRIEDLDRKIRQLTAIRDALAALVGQCNGGGPVAGCPIIEGVHAVSLEPSAKEK